MIFPLINALPSVLYHVSIMKCRCTEHRDVAPPPEFLTRFLLENLSEFLRVLIVSTGICWINYPQNCPLISTAVQMKLDSLPIFRCKNTCTSLTQGLATIWRTLTVKISASFFEGRNVSVVAVRHCMLSVVSSFRWQGDRGLHWAKTVFLYVIQEDFLGDWILNTFAHT